MMPSSINGLDEPLARIVDGALGGVRKVVMDFWIRPLHGGPELARQRAVNR